MPETFGKRQRRDARTRKIAAKEERRAARTQRKELRAAGVDVAPPGTEDAVDPNASWLGEANPVGDDVITADEAGERSS
ncbi:MAG TPA: hypothetical protein VNN79_03115 [Actinomycetota bacterium]|nr:hypothetical protein [Actinomycetota bacterium]